MMKKLEILWELTKCDTETGSEQVPLEKSLNLSTLNFFLYKQQ